MKRLLHPALLLSLLASTGPSFVTPAFCATQLKCGLATNGGGTAAGATITVIGSLGQEATGTGTASIHTLRHGAWPCRADQVIGVPGDREPVLTLAFRPASPNPFGTLHRATTLAFAVPRDAGPTSVRIYDINARLVRTLVDDDTFGERTVEWTGVDDSGRPVASGVYLAVLHAGRKTLSQKLVYVK